HDRPGRGAGHPRRPPHDLEEAQGRLAGGADVSDEGGRRDRGPEELPQVPDNRKRRIAAGCYVVAALASGAGAVSSGNGGLLAAAIFLALVAAYHFAAAWPLRLDE